MSAPVASVYRKGGRLYISVRRADGQRRGVATRQPDSPEGWAKAEKLLAQFEATQAVARQERVHVLTLDAYAERWIRRREERKAKTIADDASRLRMHVLPVLGSLALREVTSRPVRDMLHALATKQSARGKVLAPRTVRHCWTALRSVLVEAAADELIPGVPTVLRSDLPAKRDVDPEWREGAVFTRAELERLIAEPPEDRRVLYAILGLAGLRWGESAELRWRDYDPAVEPLGRIRVARSYSTRRHEVGPTKTQRLRLVPVHPVLAAVLAAWRLAHPAGPDDLVVPSREGRARSVSHGRKKLLGDLGRLDLRPRRPHDFRRSCATLLREAGASEDMARWILHGPSGSVVDAYTSTPWGALCDAMARVQVKAPGPGAVYRLSTARKVPV